MLYKFCFFQQVVVWVFLVVFYQCVWWWCQCGYGQIVIGSSRIVIEVLGIELQCYYGISQVCLSWEVYFSFELQVVQVYGLGSGLGFIIGIGNIYCYGIGVFWVVVWLDGGVRQCREFDGEVVVRICLCNVICDFYIIVVWYMVLLGRLGEMCIVFYLVGDFCFINYVVGVGFGQIGNCYDVVQFWLAIQWLEFYFKFGVFVFFYREKMCIFFQVGLYRYLFQQAILWCCEVVLYSIKFVGF